MFQTLARFQDGRGNHSDDNALERAVGRVIVAFCEATRLRSVYNEVVSRMRNKESPAVDLSEHMWKRIRGWHVLGGHWLRYGHNSEINAAELALPASFISYKYNPSAMH